MFAPVRAGLFAALFAFACVASSVTAIAARRGPDASPKSRSSATISTRPRSGSKARSRPMPGRSTKPAAQLRREMEEAFKKNDFRLGLQLLGQIVTVAPDDAASWLRLARSVSQIRPANDRERTLLLERAATAGYIAYERSDNPAEQARGAADHRPFLRRAAGVAAGARRAAHLARFARSRRHPRAI